MTKGKCAAVLLAVLCAAYAFGPVHALASSGVAPTAFTFETEDDYQENQDAPPAPGIDELDMLRVGMTGSRLRELAQTQDEILFERSQVQVKVYIKASALMGMDIADSDVFEVLIDRDNPNKNGIYIGFYLSDKRISLGFSEPFIVRAKLMGARHGLVCVDPDGSEVESLYDPAEDEMVIFLFEEGEYIFMVDENNQANPQPLEDDQEDPVDGDNTEAPPQTFLTLSDAGALAATLGDFTLIAAITAVGAVVIRAALKKLFR